MQCGQKSKIPRSGVGQVTPPLAQQFFSQEQSHRTCRKKAGSSLTVATGRGLEILASWKKRLDRDFQRTKPSWEAPHPHPFCPSYGKTEGTTPQALKMAGTQQGEPDGYRCGMRREVNSGEAHGNTASVLQGPPPPGQAAPATAEDSLSQRPPRPQGPQLPGPRRQGAGLGPEVTCRDSGFG